MLSLVLLLLATGQDPATPTAPLSAGQIRTLKIAMNAFADPDSKPGKALFEDLAKLGPNAAPAVPGLIRVFERWNGSVGKGDYHTAASAAYTLASIGPKASEAYPALLKCFATTTSMAEADGLSIRGVMPVPLSMIAPNPDALAAIFNEKLLKGYGRSTEMNQIFEALKTMGVTSKLALPGLRVSLERKRAGESDFRQDDAIGVLVAMGPAGMPTLLEEFRRDMSKREYLIALADVGPDAAPAVPLILGMLLSAHEQYRSRAANALGRIRVGSEEVLAALQESLSDSDDVRYAALEALALIGPAAVPTLIGFFNATKVDIQKVHCMEMLGRIGPGASACVPLLLEVMRTHKKEYVRYQAVKSLGLVGTTTDEVHAGLMAALNDTVAIRKAVKDATILMEVRSRKTRVGLPKR